MFCLKKEVSVLSRIRRVRVVLGAFRVDVKVSVCAELTRGAMTEFQEKLRQQHEESMHRELEALLKTAGPAEAEVRRHGAV